VATRAIAVRQLRAYARTAFGAVAVSATAGLAAVAFFDERFFAAGAASLAGLFERTLPWLLGLLAPAIAVTALVEERVRGTLDLLLASPATPRQIAAGKWLAGTALWLACLVATAPLAGAVHWLGGLDAGAALGGYLGAGALGALLVAVALAAAARARSAMTGYVSAALACGALLALHGLAAGRDLGALAYFAAPGTHLAQPAQGVLALADLGYFALATMAALEATALRIGAPRLGRRQRATRMAGAGLAAAAAVAASLLPGRIDVASDQSERLTAASRALAARVADVEVTAYFGNVPTAQRPARAVVERLLDRYARASNGRLSWRVVDPFDSGAQAQRELAARGIGKLLWSSSVDGVPQQVAVYFHVELRRRDRSSVWQPAGSLDLSSLEYELSSRLRGLVDGRPRVAVTTGAGSPERPEALLDFLATEYDAKVVALGGTDVDLAEYDLVIVNGPRQPVGAGALAALRDHRARGRPVLLLVRGMSLQRQRPVEGGPPGATQPPLLLPIEDGLDPLLADIGVRVRRGAVVDAAVNAPGAVPVRGRAVLARPLFPVVTAEGPIKLPPTFPVPFAAPMEVQAAASVVARTAPSARLRTELLPVTERTEFAADGADRGPFAVAAVVDEGGARAAVFGSADIVGDPLMSLAVRQPAFRELLAGRDAVLSTLAWLVGRAPLTEALGKAAPLSMAPVTRAERAAVKYGTAGGPAAAVWLAWWVAGRLRRRRRADQSF